jgi:hypothetical protein
MVLVYKNLHDWVIYVGHMLVNIPYMGHMGNDDMRVSIIGGTQLKLDGLFH